MISPPGYLEIEQQPRPIIDSYENHDKNAPVGRNGSADDDRGRGSRFLWAMAILSCHRHRSAAHSGRVGHAVGTLTAPSGDSPWRAPAGGGWHAVPDSRRGTAQLQFLQPRLHETGMAST